MPSNESTAIGRRNYSLRAWDGSKGGSALIGTMHRVRAFSEMVGPLRETADSGGRFAPHFSFNIVVQFIGRVPVAVEADITSLHTLGVDQLALIRFDVIQILARAKAKLVVKVI